MSLGLRKTPRLLDQWKSLANIINNPVEYWDFPTTMLAFAKSLKNSQLLLMEGGVVFRIRGKQATLINWFGEEEDMRAAVFALQSQDIKVKSLNWEKTMFFPDKGAKVKEFIVYGLYDFDLSTQCHSSKTRETLRRKHRQGKKRYTVGHKLPAREKMDELFAKWAEEASKRHFMVVKGHYQAYIDLLYKGFASCICFWEGEELIGICGYEVFGSCAQITLMKNRKAHSCFPVYFWVASVETISRHYNKVFCGSTAEGLKQQLGFLPYDTYKLKL